MLIRQHLRSSTLVAWTTAVAALLGLAVVVRTGAGPAGSGASVALVIVALLGSAAFSQTLLRLPAVASRALRPGSTLRPIARELTFLSIFCGALGLGLLVDLLLRLGSSP